MMWDDHTGGDWGAWLPMSVMMLLILAVVAWGLYLLLRNAGKQPSRSPGADGVRSPEDTLADRLARGDIDVEEYERRITALGGRVGGTPKPT